MSINPKLFSGIFRWPGGKSKYQKRFLPYLPEFSEIRFPFVGGGGIFWAVDCSKKRWINDINSHLMSVYSALRDRSEEFIKKCREIEPQKDGEECVSTIAGSTGKKYNKRLKEQFDYFVENECDEALKYFFINRTVWGGRVTYDPRMKSRLYFSNPSGWNIVKSDKLERAAAILKDVKITCGDYEELLFESGEDVCIYLDPPYLMHTNLVSSDKLYEFGFEYSDHLLLCKNLKKCQHKWMLSYDDCEEVREWYKDFNLYPLDLTYCGSSMEKKKNGKELIITNYVVRKHNSVDIFEG